MGTQSTWGHQSIQYGFPKAERSSRRAQAPHRPPDRTMGRSQLQEASPRNGLQVIPHRWLFPRKGHRPREGEQRALPLLSLVYGRWQARRQRVTTPAGLHTRGRYWTTHLTTASPSEGQRSSTQRNRQHTAISTRGICVDGVFSICLASAQSSTAPQSTRKRTPTRHRPTEDEMQDPTPPSRRQSWTLSV